MEPSLLRALWRRRLPKVALASALVVSPACSSTASRTPSASATIYTTAYCARLDRCQTRQVRDNFGDADTCTRLVAPDTDDEFRSAGTSITEAQAQACATAMSQAPCDVLTSALPPCQFVGALEAGAPCGSGYQCKSGSCFRAIDSGVLALCGTCSTRVPEGGNCTNANCEGGLLCAAGHCKALAGAGASCNDNDQPCKPTLQCWGGKCQVPLGANATCTPAANDGTDSLQCDSAQLLFCAPLGTDPTKGTCTPVRYAGLGNACGLDGATKALVSCAGASCSSSSSSSSSGTCVADVPEGNACDPMGAPCEVPLACIDGRCGRSSIAACR